MSHTTEGSESASWGEPSRDIRADIEFVNQKMLADLNPANWQPIAPLNDSLQDGIQDIQILQLRSMGIPASLMGGSGNNFSGHVNSMLFPLLGRAHRNPPPAEWHDSPEEDCPFVEGNVDAND